MCLLLFQLFQNPGVQHVNVSGVVQGSLNTCMSWEDLQFCQSNQGYNLIWQEHASLTLPAHEHEMLAQSHSQTSATPTAKLSSWVSLHNILQTLHFCKLHRDTHILGRDLHLAFIRTKMHTQVIKVPNGSRILKADFTMSPYYGSTTYSLSEPPLISNFPCQNANPFYLN